MAAFGLFVPHQVCRPTRIYKELWLFLHVELIRASLLFQRLIFVFLFFAVGRIDFLYCNSKHPFVEYPAVEQSLAYSSGTFSGASVLPSLKRLLLISIVMNDEGKNNVTAEVGNTNHQRRGKNKSPPKWEIRITNEETFLA